MKTGTCVKLNTPVFLACVVSSGYEPDIESAPVDLMLDGIISSLS